MKPFIIEHPDGRRYELSDPAFFRREYEPQGFVIAARQPTEYEAPDLPSDAVVALSEQIASGEAPNLEKLSRAELNEFAVARGIAHAHDLPNKDAVIAAIAALTDPGDPVPQSPAASNEPPDESEEAHDA